MVTIVVRLPLSLAGIHELSYTDISPIALTQDELKHCQHPRSYTSNKQLEQNWSP